MSRSKPRHPRSTSSGERAEPVAPRRPSRSPRVRGPLASGDSDLASHLDLVATIGLLHSLFAARSHND